MPPWQPRRRAAWLIIAIPEPFQLGKHPWRNQQGESSLPNWFKVIPILEKYYKIINQQNFHYQLGCSIHHNLLWPEKQWQHRYARTRLLRNLPYKRWWCLALWLLHHCSISPKDIRCIANLPHSNAINDPSYTSIVRVLFKLRRFNLGFILSWPINKVLIKSSMPNKCLNLISEQNALLDIMVVVMVEQAKLIQVPSVGGSSHPPWTRQIHVIFDLH